MGNDGLAADVSEPSVAVSVYVPTRSMAQFANAATPAGAGCGFAARDNVAPAGVVIARFTKLVSVVTTFPTASSTLTTGWVPNAVPPVELDGCVVKVTFAAGPTAIVSELLTSAVNEP